MTSANPFAKWRARRAVGAAPANAQTLQSYSTIYMSRGWAMLLLLLMVPVAVGAIATLVLFEAELNAIPYSTGMRVVAMLGLIALMIVVPLLGPSSRRQWSLFADRIEIAERPLVPLLGPYRRARIAFADIAEARLGETLNGMNILELETKTGRCFRLAPTHKGSGKQVELDHGGFDGFIGAIRTAIERSGVPLPQGRELRMATSGLAGIVILAVVSGLLAALGLLGAFVALGGEPVGFQMITVALPFFLLFGGLLLGRWRKWRAGTG